MGYAVNRAGLQKEVRRIAVLVDETRAGLGAVARLVHGDAVLGAARARACARSGMHCGVVHGAVAGPVHGGAVLGAARARAPARSGVHCGAVYGALTHGMEGDTVLGASRASVRSQRVHGGAVLGAFAEAVDYDVVLVAPVSEASTSPGHHSLNLC